MPPADWLLVRSLFPSENHEWQRIIFRVSAMSAFTPNHPGVKQSTPPKPRKLPQVPPTPPSWCARQSARVPERSRTLTPNSCLLLATYVHIN